MRRDYFQSAAFAAEMGIDLGDDLAAESYFKDCERNEKGWCLPSGESGSPPTEDAPKAAEPKPTSASPPKAHVAVRAIAPEKRLAAATQLASGMPLRKDLTQAAADKILIARAAWEWEKLEPHDSERVEQLKARVAQRPVEELQDVLQETFDRINREVYHRESQTLPPLTKNIIAAFLASRDPISDYDEASRRWALAEGWGRDLYSGKNGSETLGRMERSRLLRYTFEEALQACLERELITELVHNTPDPPRELKKYTTNHADKAWFAKQLAGSDRSFADDAALQARSERVRAWSSKQLRAEDPARVDREIAAIEAHWAREMKNKAVWVRADVAVATSILADGFMRNQHESMTSNGLLNPSRREEVEDWLFSGHRPVYGYVDGRNSIGEDHGGVGQYGSLRFRLKDEVRERTTITGDDSLNHAPDNDDYQDAYIPSAFLAPRIESFDQSVVEETLTERLALDPYMLEQQGDMLLPSVYMSPALYVEAQVHGGVTLDDIAEIVVPKMRPGPWAVDQAFLDLAEARGIPVRFVDDEDDDEG